MKTLIMMATMAAVISLAVSHVAVAQDRETHAMRLFDVSERIQRSGPCKELTFLWLTNPKMIAFLESLLSGAYDDDGPKLLEYIACFEHQRAFVRIRTVIHAEFPGTKAAFKVAERGYFTDADIDEFIWLLEGTVKPVTAGGSKQTLNGADLASPTQIRPTTSAKADAETLIDRAQGTVDGADARMAALDVSRTVRTSPSQSRRTSIDTGAVATPADREQSSQRGAGAQEGTLEEADGNRITHLKPLGPIPPSEEAVAALQQSLEREIQEFATLVPNGHDIPRASQRKLRSRINPDRRAQPQVQETSALAERLRRMGELRARTRFGIPRRSFALSSPENQRTRIFQPGTARVPLAAGDQVRVTVFGEDDLSGEFEVDATGQLSLPLIGRVTVAGGSADQLEAFVATTLRLDGYVKRPRVSVEILSMRPIFIMGEVNRPGSYPYSTGLTVLKAIALAGGFTYRAKRKVLFVTRDPEQGEQEIRVDNLVLPGDTIRVNKRWF